MRIERVRVGQVWSGESVCDVDDDDLTTDAAINADYRADEQDWQVVVTRRGHADVGQLLLQMYNGERYNGERYWTASQSWDQWVWRLVDDAGNPIVSEVNGE